ncbi:MAG: hypothetical protein GVY13_13980 [Alphaproteobacteria bacterium]|jgi:hypothetical protein|nr:hypothetical protein [Alphaproteobacteria bacterium]
MADVNMADLTLEELTREQPESTDPEYLAWKRRQIEEAVAHADAFPDDVLTEEEVWKKRGLEY